MVLVAISTCGRWFVGAANAEAARCLDISSPAADSTSRRALCLEKDSKQRQEGQMTCFLCDSVLHAVSFMRKKCATTCKAQDHMLANKYIKQDT